MRTIQEYGSTMTPTIAQPSPPPRVKNCFCCPFGYHIDLDFVKYCEDFNVETAENGGGRNPRRDRRKHRQSMEVMLGLQESLPWIHSLTAEVIPESDAESPSRRHQERDWVSQIEDIPPQNGYYNGSYLAREACKQTPEFLEDVCFDFERTLERSKSKPPSSDEPDVPELVTFSRHSKENGRSVSYDFERELDQASEISNGSEVNPLALQQVREQMALSLARMKELEEQVKLIPALQNQLVSLKEEKRLLQLEVKRGQETKRSSSKSSSPPTTTSGIFSPQRVSPVSLASLNESISHLKKPNKQVSEASTCTPALVTRDVGITPPPPEQPKKLQSTATYTELSVLPNERLYTKRELDQFMQQQNTARWMNQVSVGVQFSEVKPFSRQTGTQTLERPQKVVASVGVNTKPDVRDVALHYAPQLRSVGVSEDTIADQEATRAAPEAWAVPTTSPISLKALDRSRSFSLAENEKLKIRRKHASVQCTALMANASTQHHPSTANKTVQNVPEVYSQCTDTKGLVEVRNVHSGTEVRPGKDAYCNTEAPRTREAGVSARESPRRTIESSSNTDRVTLRSTGCGDERIEIRDLSPERPKTLNLVTQIVERTNMPPSPVAQDSVSRIPKLSPSPTATRKIVRQNTYTIASQLSSSQKPPVAARSVESISVPVRESPPLSAALPKPTPLERSEIKSLSLGSITKPPESQPEGPKYPSSAMRQTTITEIEVKPLKEEAEEAVSDKESSPNLIENEAYESSEESEAPVEEIKEVPKGSVDTAFGHFGSSFERTKASPSKEMAAALKVINDSLQKGGSASSNLKSATQIVQKEWFKVSSTESANPLDVEDYLDCFEEYSSDLFRYMVNLTDANGNTTMHYAVSHGNFDVVSILLDSKVCKVNLTNNAGYTSVMLVSLAKLQTPEHRTVVQRLFQVSDVNIRAKKHNQTSLMLAVSHGNLEMVKMLLEAGADINIQDDDGSTALMCAAEHGRIDIVKLLLAHPECDSTIQDIDGSTALKISLEAGYRDIGVLLYAHERIRNKSPYSSLRRKKERTISGGSNGAGTAPAGRPSSAKTSPLPSPKFVPKKEPFKP